RIGAQHHAVLQVHACADFQSWSDTRNELVAAVELEAGGTTGLGICRHARVARGKVHIGLQIKASLVEGTRRPQACARAIYVWSAGRRAFRSWNGQVPADPVRAIAPTQRGGERPRPRLSF